MKTIATILLLVAGFTVAVLNGAPMIPVYPFCRPPLVAAPSAICSGMGL